MDSSRKVGAWPDADGSFVSIGDFIEVWCSWTGEPKFNGRHVRVVGVLSGADTAVFKLEDPAERGTHHYMPASSNSFRRVPDRIQAGQSGIVERSALSADESGERLRGVN